ncbi:MAG: hypothetical protein BWY76_01665 [bacterium ADurb.Bin429]|nr:MAG: hypothetical protein BWY76_01665 [bacterium ADurb.Bin429]
MWISTHIPLVSAHLQGSRKDRYPNVQCQEPWLVNGALAVITRAARWESRTSCVTSPMPLPNAGRGMRAVRHRGRGRVYLSAHARPGERRCNGYQYASHWCRIRGGNLRPARQGRHALRVGDGLIRRPGGGGLERSKIGMGLIQIKCESLITNSTQQFCFESLNLFVFVRTQSECILAGKDDAILSQ